MSLSGLARRLFFVAMLLGLTLSAHAAEDNAVVAESLREIFQSGKADTGSAAANADIDAIRDIYVVRDFKPIWVRDNGPKTKAKALLGELKISGVHGLSPTFYNVPEIETLMTSTAPEDLARLDVLLSGAAAEFGHDLANGRIGPDVAPSENAVEPVAMTPAQFVAGAEAAENLRDFAGGVLKDDYRYIRMIAKLAEFSRIEASGVWPAIDPAGPEIAPGAKDARLKDIRTLLVLTGDMTGQATDGDATLNPTVGEAVRAFQVRHGLEQTGAVDKATLAEMAVPLADRIRQIRINLERRRWQNRDLGPDSIYINLADSEVKMVHGGKSERFVSVTNAAELDALPTFFGSIDGVEILPSGGVALTVQSPFIDRLGGEGSQRAVALSDAALLAGDLLASHAPEGVTLESLLAAGKPTTVKFDRPVPLFVTFVTAWANRDGSIHFRRDPLGRDAKIAALLQLD